MVSLALEHQDLAVLLALADKTVYLDLVALVATQVVAFQALVEQADTLDLAFQVSLGTQD